MAIFTLIGCLPWWVSAIAILFTGGGTDVRSVVLCCEWSAGCSGKLPRSSQKKASVGPVALRLQRRWRDSLRQLRSRRPVRPTSRGCAAAAIAVPSFANRKAHASNPLRGTGDQRHPARKAHCFLLAMEGGITIGRKALRGSPRPDLLFYCLPSLVEALQSSPARLRELAVP